MEPSYVYLPGVPGGEAIAKETGVDFFSVPVELGVCLSDEPLDSVDLMTDKHCSPTVSRRLPTPLLVSVRRRRSSSRLPLRVSRATSRRASNSPTSLPRSKSPLFDPLVTSFCRAARQFLVRMPA